MRKSRFSKEEIAFALRQSDAGIPISRVYREVGVNERCSFSGGGPSAEATRRRDPRAKVACSGLVAGQGDAVGCLAGKTLKPDRRRTNPGAPVFPMAAHVFAGTLVEENRPQHSRLWVANQPCGRVARESKRLAAGGYDKDRRVHAAAHFAGVQSGYHAPRWCI